MKKARNRRGNPEREPRPARAAINPQFAQLKAVRRTLQNADVEQAREQLVQRQRVEQARDDVDLFRRSVGTVTPLKPHGRALQGAAMPRPLPYQRWADNDAVMRESVSDDYGAEWLLESDETLSYRRTGMGVDVVRKLRRGHWLVSTQLDLHGMRVDEARTAVADFLRECVRQQRRCVRIIHGKGLGSANRVPILKEKVRRWLVQKDEVLAFVEARPDDGGAGVVLVLLRG